MSFVHSDNTIECGICGLQPGLELVGGRYLLRCACTGINVSMVDMPEEIRGNWSTGDDE